MSQGITDEVDVLVEAEAMGRDHCLPCGHHRRVERTECRGPQQTAVDLRGRVHKVADRHPLRLAITPWRPANVLQRPAFHLSILQQPE